VWVEVRDTKRQVRLRPHLRDRARLDGQAMVFRRQVDRAAEDRTSPISEAVDMGSPRWKTSAGDLDFQRMRGLPLLAPGVQGVQRRTDPARALFAKESGRLRSSGRPS
jgi:hypothetical protein